MALAETQHHDGISGTARWYVVGIFTLSAFSFLSFCYKFEYCKDMYHNDLYAGEEQALQIAENGLGALLNVKSPLPLSNSSSGMQSISKGTYLLILLFVIFVMFFIYFSKIHTSGCAEYTRVDKK